MTLLRYRCILLVVLATLVSAVARPAAAARLWECVLERDGQVLLQTYYQDQGRADAAAMWRQLGTEPLMADTDPTFVAAEGGDPLVQVLTGSLRLRIQHKRNVLASCELSRLELRRTGTSSQGWYLAESEVARTASAAGLRLGPRREVRRTAAVALVSGGVLLAGFAASLGVLLLISQRRRSQTSH